MSSDPASFNLTHHFLIAMPGLNDEFFGKSVVYVCEHSPRGALGLIVNKPSYIKLEDLFDKLELPLRRADVRGMPVFHGGPLQTERGFVLHETMGAVLPVGHDHTPPEVAKALHDALHGLRTAERMERGDSFSEPTEAPAAEAEPAPKKRRSRKKTVATLQLDTVPLPSAYASTLHIEGGVLEMTTSRDVLEAISSGAGPQNVFVSLGYSSWGEGQLEVELAENSWLTVAADPTVIFNTPVEQRYDKALALLGVQAWMLTAEAGHA